MEILLGVGLQVDQALVYFLTLNKPFLIYDFALWPFTKIFPSYINTSACVREKPGLLLYLRGLELIYSCKGFMRPLVSAFRGLSKVLITTILKTRLLFYLLLQFLDYMLN